MKIKQLHALRVRIPQKPPIAPHQSRYRAGSFKESLLVRLETDTGLVGWGETPDDWVNRSYEGTPEDRLRAAVLGRDPRDLEAFYAEGLKPGEWLGTEAKMAERFNVSRVTIRDAVSGLAARGLIDVRVGALTRGFDLPGAAKSERPHEFAHFFRVELFEECRGSDEIAEYHRQLAPFDRASVRGGRRPGS